MCTHTHARMLNTHLNSTNRLFDNCKLIPSGCLFTPRTLSITAFYWGHDLRLTIRDDPVVRALAEAVQVTHLKYVWHTHRMKLNENPVSGNDRENHVYAKLNSVYSRVCPTGCNVRRQKLHKFHGTEGKGKPYTQCFLYIILHVLYGSHEPTCFTDNMFWNNILPH